MLNLVLRHRDLVWHLGSAWDTTRYALYLNEAFLGVFQLVTTPSEQH